MLKHCQATAAEHHRRSRRHLDNASLNSSGSNSFNSSFGSSCSTSSPTKSSGMTVTTLDSRRSSYAIYQPMDQLCSRTSSFSSLSIVDPTRTAIKIYAKCLRPDIEYKTLGISQQTTSQEVIRMLLAKYKMRHRDPNLFFLTMDLSLDRARMDEGVMNNSKTIVLDDDAKPAELKSCQPWGGDLCRFTLQMRSGSLVRVYDSVLMSGSKYKCLLIADHTTVSEVISLLLHCYGLPDENVDRFCLVEQCADGVYERRLHPKDLPAQVQSLWPKNADYSFVLEPNRMNIYSSITPSPVSSDLSSDDSLSSPSPRSVVNFRLHAPVRPLAGTIRRSPPAPPPSIHESGLPPPPALPVKPKHASLIMLTASMASLSSSSSSSTTSSSSSSANMLHDYENYFYI